MILCQLHFLIRLILFPFQKLREREHQKREERAAERRSARKAREAFMVCENS